MSLKFYATYPFSTYQLLKPFLDLDLLIPFTFLPFLFSIITLTYLFLFPIKFFVFQSFNSSLIFTAKNQSFAQVQSFHINAILLILIFHLLTKLPFNFISFELLLNLCLNLPSILLIHLSLYLISQLLILKLLLSL